MGRLRERNVQERASRQQLFIFSARPAVVVRDPLARVECKLSDVLLPHRVLLYTAR